MFNLYDGDKKVFDSLSIPELIDHCKLFLPEGFYTVYFDGFPIMRLYNHYTSYEYEVTIILLNGINPVSYFSKTRKSSYIEVL